MDIEITFLSSKLALIINCGKDHRTVSRGDLCFFFHIQCLCFAVCCHLFQKLLLKWNWRFRKRNLTNQKLKMRLRTSKNGTFIYTYSITNERNCLLVWKIKLEIVQSSESYGWHLSSAFAFTNKSVTLSIPCLVDLWAKIE